MKTSALTAAIAAFLALTAFSQGTPSETRGWGLSRAEFERVFADMLPKPEQGESKYLDEFVWETSLWGARKKAAEQGKALFVGAPMRGVPGPN